MSERCRLEKFCHRNLILWPSGTLVSMQSLSEYLHVYISRIYRKAFVSYERTELFTNEAHPRPNVCETIVKGQKLQV